MPVSIARTGDVLPRKTHNRARSNSRGEVEDGVEQEHSDRISRVICSHILHLCVTRQISSDLYNDIQTGDEYDNLASRLRASSQVDKDRKVVSLCKRYVVMQRQTEIDTIGNIMWMGAGVAPYALRVRDVNRYIRSFL